MVHTHSLYSGKVRSYLIKKGCLPRTVAAHPRFGAEVLPAVRHFVVPSWKPPTASSSRTALSLSRNWASLPRARDGADYADAAGLATLLGGFGSRACCRWPCITAGATGRSRNTSCGRVRPGGAPRADREGGWRAALPSWTTSMAFAQPGGHPATAPAFEASFEELLDVLDIHFQHYPYLLGGLPSIADFGFMAPLFAHLDPVPSTLMKNRAPNVYRWTERMNLPAIADGEFPEQANAWFPNDAIPATLEPIIRLMFRTGASSCWRMRTSSMPGSGEARRGAGAGSPRPMASAGCTRCWVRSATPGAVSR